MLKNANISSSGVLPMCQDTGTAIIMGYKGEKVFTDSDDNEFLSLGVYKTYKENNLRFSQLAPVSMFEEKILLTIYPQKSVFLLMKVRNINLPLYKKVEDQLIKVFYSKQHPPLLILKI